jgi:signal transduction histidine kinase
VDLVAYRIVQEGLTNVLKHAGKNVNPQVRLVWGTQSLRIQVDNGTGLEKVAHIDRTIGGWGLRGLRERVDSIGGSLSAEPRAGAGYQLTATLPIPKSVIPYRLPSTFGHMSPVEATRAEKL